MYTAEEFDREMTAIDLIENLTERYHNKIKLIFCSDNIRANHYLCIFERYLLDDPDPGKAFDLMLVNAARDMLEKK